MGISAEFNKFISASLGNQREDDITIKYDLGMVSVKKDLDREKVQQMFMKNMPEIMNRIHHGEIVNVNDFSLYFHIDITRVLLAFGIHVELFKLFNTHPGKTTDENGRITIFVRKGKKW